ncbi:hypothetical protein [Acuticoccus sediminis]|uniref:hypothetical protein n=1 Tax=Acuticoccus sediminis TaxID=2184697 RepID=UPI001CFE50B4|nr:hypothetical protein [Acuticoccus sediminis]
MNYRAMALCLAALTAYAAAPAAADSLLGRTAAFSVLAYDEPDKPRYQGLIHTATISDEIEFGLLPEGVQNGLDVVPVIVDISANRIEIDFSPSPPGLIADATFNGYVLSFAPDCLVFNNARVDASVTTLPVANGDITIEGRTLYVNLQGLAYDRSSHVGILLDVTDCPLA